MSNAEVYDEGLVPVSRILGSGPAKLQTLHFYATHWDIAVFSSHAG